MGPNFARSAPKVGAVAKAIEVDFQGEGSWSVSPPQTRHDPDSVMSNARSRTAKLEAVMVAVGESFSTCPCRRHVHWQRFSQFKTALQAPNLITGARKRVFWRQSTKGVETAKAELAKAEAKLAFEEDELSKAEHRLVALQHEAKTVPVSTPSRRGQVQEDADIPPAGALSIEVGQIRVPQTEPDSSEADAIQLLTSCCLVFLQELPHVLRVSDGTTSQTWVLSWCTWMRAYVADSSPTAARTSSTRSNRHAV